MRYAKCSFTDTRNQKNTLKSSPLFKKNTKKQIRLNNLRVLRIKDAKFSGCYIYMNTSIQETF